MKTFIEETGEPDSFSSLKDTSNSNVTKDAYLFIGIEPNEKNDVIKGIIEKNPLKSLFDQRNDSSLSELLAYKNQLSNITESQRKVFPTCAELNDDNKLIVLFRVTPTVVGAGDRYPFGTRGYICGPQGIFRLGNLAKYGDKKSLTGSHHVSVINMGNVISGIKRVGGDVKELLENFENNPSENEGNLIEVYRAINRSGLGNL